MIRFLIIHHNTGHGTTHYDTVDAPDRDAAIARFDAWSADTGTIFIDALSTLDLVNLSSRILTLIDDPSIP